MRPTGRVLFHDRMPDAASGAVAATTLVTPTSVRVRGGGPWPEETHEQAVAWEDGRITYVGPADGLTGVEPEYFVEGTIAPGFVD